MYWLLLELSLWGYRRIKIQCLNVDCLTSLTPLLSRLSLQVVILDQQNVYQVKLNTCTQSMLLELL